MNTYTTRHFLISCERPDASPMAVLMEGCRVHAEVDAFPLWTVENESLTDEALARIPPFSELEETWVAHFPTRAGLECFAELLATVEFKAPDMVRFLEFDSSLKSWASYTMGKFHRNIFHPS